MEAHKGGPKLVSQSVVAGCDRGHGRPRPGSGCQLPDDTGNTQESCVGRESTGPSTAGQSV